MDAVLEREIRGLARVTRTGRVWGVFIPALLAALGMSMSDTDAPPSPDRAPGPDTGRPAPSPNNPPPAPGDKPVVKPGDDAPKRREHLGVRRLGFAFATACFLAGLVGAIVTVACLPNGTDCHNYLTDEANLTELLNSGVVSPDPAVIADIQAQIGNDAYLYATYCNVG